MQRADVMAITEKLNIRNPNAALKNQRCGGVPVGKGNVSPGWGFSG